MSANLNERSPLSTIYNSDVLAQAFPTLSADVDSFLMRNQGIVATMETPADILASYTQDLQTLAATIRGGLMNNNASATELFFDATSPARTHGFIENEDTGRVGMLGNKATREPVTYHVLERVIAPSDNATISPRDLVILLQRVRAQNDTGPEVHGLAQGLGGIEVYIPLTDGITFFINGVAYSPKALESLLTILPGDNHHHVKLEKGVPGRVLIVGGFGFSRGTKTDQETAVAAFNEIPRITVL